MLKSRISNIAFWDTSFGELDVEKSALYVMEKIFNYGNWSDQVAAINYYGLPRIKEEIVKSAYLRRPVLSFLCTILQLQKTDFKCCNSLQFNPLPYSKPAADVLPLYAHL